MSSKRKPARRPPAVDTPPQPLIGALLRLPREYIRQRMFRELQQGGFDVSETEMAVFMYPGPDGRRPIDLARQCNMTRQAMNYVLAGLEGRGYIVRQAEAGARPAHGIQVTERGWEMFAKMRSVVVEVEREWRAHLGAERFNDLRDTLHELSHWVEAAEAKPLMPRPLMPRPPSDAPDQ